MILFFFFFNAYWSWIPLSPAGTLMCKSSTSKYLVRLKQDSYSLDSLQEPILSAKSSPGLCLVTSPWNVLRHIWCPHSPSKRGHPAWNTHLVPVLPKASELWLPMSLFILSPILEHRILPVCRTHGHDKFMKYCYLLIVLRGF